jgi:hypothetical protein
MTNVGIWPMLAMIFLGPLAQLYVRIFYLSGSLDKIWLMLLSFPPISLIPSLLIYFGYVADGQGGTPYDMYMWLPTILSLLGSFAADKLDDMDYGIIVQMSCRMIVPLLGGTTAFYMRDYNNCIKENAPQDSLFLKSFSNAIIAQGFAHVLNTLVYYIPFVGMALTVISYIPMMELVILGIIYATMYILLNMFNYASGSKDYCGSSSTRIARTIFTIVGLILCVVNELKDQFFDI